MESLEETLYARIDALIETHKGRLLYTVGDRAILAEIVSRLEGTEMAIREIALELDQRAIPRGA